MSAGNMSQPEKLGLSAEPVLLLALLATVVLALLVPPPAPVAVLVEPVVVEPLVVLSVELCVEPVVVEPLFVEALLVALLPVAPLAALVLKSLEPPPSEPQPHNVKPARTATIDARCMHESVQPNPRGFKPRDVCAPSAHCGFTGLVRERVERVKHSHMRKMIAELARRSGVLALGAVER